LKNVTSDGQAPDDLAQLHKLELLARLEVLDPRRHMLVWQWPPCYMDGPSFEKKGKKKRFTNAPGFFAT